MCYVTFEQKSILLRHGNVLVGICFRFPYINMLILEAGAVINIPGTPLVMILRWARMCPGALRSTSKS